MIDDPNKAAGETKERRDASRRWMNDNYWPEILEVFQLYKCRVDPLKKEDGTEDKTRTNLCMPDVWVMTRRKAARLSSRPPVLKVRAENPAVGEYLSHLCQYQWDRSHEQQIQKRHVLQAELLGYSFKAHWWDKVIEARRFRRSTKEILRQHGIAVDEESGEFGVPTEQEINGIPGRLPWEQPEAQAEGEPQPKSRQIVPFDRFNDEQVASVVGQVGPEMFWYKDLRKYEGPVSSFVFLGDIHLEPGCESIHKSAWVIHEQIWDAETLRYWLEQTYEDPRTGESHAAIDEKVAKDLWDSQPSWSKDRDKSEDLKNELRAKLFKTSSEVDPRLIPTKRFHIMAEYTFRDGWPYLRWIGNEKYVLQEGMPLPWDLGGRYPFSGLTPIPDLLYFVGDSTPRVLRHLVKAHNVTVDQRMDLVSNAMKPFVLKRKGEGTPPEVIDRGLYRVLEVDSITDWMFPGVQSQVPPEAWEQEKQLLLQMASAEPTLNTFGTESQAQPGSSMVATVANYQARAGETLSQDELENLNLSLAEETEIKLLMWQQNIDEGIMQDVGRYAQSLAAGGMESPKLMRVDPLELQQDFQVQPEMGSTLALDDEMRRTDALQIYQLSLNDPINLNTREAAIQLVQTYKGRDVTKLINPPLPPKPDTPEVKPTLSVAFRDLPKWAQHQVLERFGIKVPQAEKMLDAALGGIEKVSQAADALANLEQPVQAEVGEQNGEEPNSDRQ